MGYIIFKDGVYVSKSKEESDAMSAYIGGDKLYKEHDSNVIPESEIAVGYFVKNPDTGEIYISYDEKDKYKD